MDFKRYKRKGVAEMRPYVLDEKMGNISVSPTDYPPADMGMVARKYFEDNFEEIEQKGGI